MADVPPAASEANDQGNDLFDDGNFAEAVTAYTKAIELCPNYSWAYCNRAAVFLALNQAAKAIADYSEAIAIDPNDSALYNGRGYALAMVEDSDLSDALKDADKAIELDGENGAAHCTKGFVLSKLAGKLPADSPDRARLLDEGVLHCNQAIKLEPDADEPREYLQKLRGMQGGSGGASGDTEPAPEPAAAGSGTAADGAAGGPEGWLHKKGGLKDGERNWMKGGRRNWKLRWFMFDGKAVKWFENKGAKELGSLELDPQCRVDVDPDKCAPLSPHAHARTHTHHTHWWQQRASMPAADPRV